MAKRHKLLELEGKHGDLNAVIPPLVNTGGQAQAAQALGTTQATVSKWLRDNGYASHTVYVKHSQYSAAVIKLAEIANLRDFSAAGEAAFAAQLAECQRLRQAAFDAEQAARESEGQS